MKQVFNLKIFTLSPPKSAIDVVADWEGEDFPKFAVTEDIEECLAQPFKVAALPAQFNLPGGYAYNQTYDQLDLSKFDLLLLSDIEYNDPQSIIDYTITRKNIKDYVLAIGAVDGDRVFQDTIYRPWWMFQHMRLNNYVETETSNKPYIFDALLGAIKAHRSYVMARFQTSNLLNHSIVTYRDIFHSPGETWISDTDPGLNYTVSKETKRILGGQTIFWPYVSPNLDQSWEVAKNHELHRGISEITPWQIYRQTLYSICCETLYTNPGPNKNDKPGPFFITEKTTKLLLAKRLFIMFGPLHTLKFLREQGFKTFNGVIDESYDNVIDPVKRFQLAFDQAEILAKLDPNYVLSQTKSIREHNYQHLYQYRKEIKNRMYKMVLDKIPDEFCS